MTAELRRAGLRAAVVLTGVITVSAAFAQNYNQNYNGNRVRRPQGQAVTTQPSNSPFTNPIMQPLPPAVSVNPVQNSNRSNVPYTTNGPGR